MLKIILKHRILSWLFISAALAIAGCATPPPPPPQKVVVQEDAVYVVRRGDTLGTIAEEMTGTKDNAQEIADYNRLKKKSKLSVGQRLIIPARLMPPRVEEAPPQTADSASDDGQQQASGRLSPEAESALMGAIIGGVVTAITTRGGHSGGGRSVGGKNIEDVVPTLLGQSGGTGSGNGGGGGQQGHKGDGQQGNKGGEHQGHKGDGQQEHKGKGEGHKKKKRDSDQ